MYKQTSKHVNGDDTTRMISSRYAEILLGRGVILGYKVEKVDEKTLKITSHDGRVNIVLTYYGYDYES